VSDDDDDDLLIGSVVADRYSSSPIDDVWSTMSIILHITS